ncbi:MAG TPA: flagellar brake protein [Rhodocyclaceae bacterium]|nr:flagellar brake protein [Rhodocyclaceae bacterium]
MTPSANDILSTDEFSQYLLRSKSEIFSIFRGMVERVTQVTMFFNEGKCAILTSMIAYNDSGVTFDYGANAEMNRKAMVADKVFCVAFLDKVKVQFILRGLRHTEVDGRSAFFASLPDSVLRLQRREYYRLSTPVARPLKCIVPVTSDDGVRRSIEFHVGDISGGGIGLINVPMHIPMETGMEFQGGKIDLPEVGSVSFNFQVRSVFEATSRSGSRTKRIGCEFIRLPGPMLTLIQRYIIKVERERKARESGML